VIRNFVSWIGWTGLEQLDLIDDFIPLLVWIIYWLEYGAPWCCDQSLPIINIGCLSVLKVMRTSWFHKNCFLFWWLSGQEHNNFCNHFLWESWWLKWSFQYIRVRKIMRISSVGTSSDEPSVVIPHVSFNFVALLKFAFSLYLSGPHEIVLWWLMNLILIFLIPG
jgi:hypothetical protein